MDSAVLRVIFGHTIEKLTLPSGIPETMEEVYLAVRQTLKITDDFTLQYLDTDFEDFFTLHATSEIKNKATIKVVTIDPVILKLCPVAHNESNPESVTSDQSFDAASTSAIAQDSTDSWSLSSAASLANYRAKLRGFGVADVACNALKHKLPEDRKSAKNIKKPRRAEVNYLPSYPVGEDEHSLEKAREQLKAESKKKDNEKIVKEMMNKTFSLRRHEVINLCPSVQTMKDRWPVLFNPSQISAEFQRITTVHLEPKFMSALDRHTPKLLTLFRAKCGVLGAKLKSILKQLEDTEGLSIERTREVVLRCLIEYLGEHGDHLIKEFNDTENCELLEELVLAITVTTKPGTSATKSPKDIGIVIEGVQVITDVGSIARACSILLGLTYVLHLDYPKQLKYTFEVFQKLFMELEASKLSNKVQSLKGKLLS